MAGVIILNNCNIFSALHKNNKQRVPTKYSKQFNKEPHGTEKRFLRPKMQTEERCN